MAEGSLPEERGGNKYHGDAKPLSLFSSPPGRRFLF